MVGVFCSRGCWICDLKDGVSERVYLNACLLVRDTNWGESRRCRYMGLNDKGATWTMPVPDKECLFVTADDKEDIG